MKYSHLVGKLAGDKDSQKLGKIIGIEKLPRDWKSEKNNRDDRLIEHLIILVHRLFKKDIGVPVDAEKVIKEDGNFVWLDISKEEFKDSVKNAKDIILAPKGNPQHEEQWKVRWRNFNRKYDRR
ncbi:MAG: hypothetical protein GF308_21695 [Candidatus Heimdallarchaeota archaeon]|nr:hypothetical protein [Candidatus Heimdallarchaeota archaeon]